MSKLSVLGLILGSGCLFVAALWFFSANIWNYSSKLNAPKVGELISSAVTPVGCFIYSIWGILQYAAIESYFTKILGWNWIIASPIALFSASIPILGSILGIIGAINVWHWPLLAAIALYFGHFILLGILTIFKRV
jgi:hypothetical protein